MLHKMIAFLTLTIITFLSACSAPTTPAGPVNPVVGSDSNRAQTDNPVEGEIVVFAAASLSGPFQEIGKEFETAHPGVKVRFNFAGSQILRTQLEQGAAADVFASADHKNMDSLAADKLVSSSGVKDFASNRLVVILPGDNPGNITRLRDLSRTGIKLILADASVPAGSYARQVLTNLSTDQAYGSEFSQEVLANVVSNETDVKQVVAKVELGEADAGIVYMSDALASPELKTISIPDIFNVIARYPIAALSNASNPASAQEFVDFILSPAGQTILKKWGFSEVSSEP